MGAIVTFEGPRVARQGGKWARTCCQRRSARRLIAPSPNQIVQQVRGHAPTRSGDDPYQVGSHID